VIDIAGATQRSFIFPADLPTARAYFGDFKRILQYLPHISLVKAYAPDRFRVLYNTTEMGLYRVRLYCDLGAGFDERDLVLHMAPLTGISPVKPKATLNSFTAQGYYASRSIFHAEGEHTRIEYRLALKAKLAKPLGLNFVPDAILERVAFNITQRRIHEIAEGFIDRAIGEFHREHAGAHHKRRSSSPAKQTRTAISSRLDQGAT